MGCIRYVWPATHAICPRAVKGARLWPCLCTAATICGSVHTPPGGGFTAGVGAAEAAGCAAATAGMAAGADGVASPGSLIAHTSKSGAGCAALATYCHCPVILPGTTCPPELPGRCSQAGRRLGPPEPDDVFPCRACMSLFQAACVQRHSMPRHMPQPPVPAVTALRKACKSHVHAACFRCPWTTFLGGGLLLPVGCRRFGSSTRRPRLAQVPRPR